MIKQIINLALIILIVNSAISGDQVNNISQISSAYTGKFYSGNLAVSNDVKMQYWFFPIQPNKEGAPVLVWLNSGPGCSFVIDALGGNGPFVINEEGSQTLFIGSTNPWNIDANVLYIDSPGVGFSTLPKDYGKLTDSQVIQYFYEALQKWFKGFSEYKSNEVYIAGSGYGGTYALLLNEYIYDQNSLDLSEKIQIKGSLVGNPVVTTDQFFSREKHFPIHYMEFLVTMGVFEYQSLEDFGLNCGLTYDEEKINTEKCQKEIEKIKSATYGLNTRDINANCELDDKGGNDYDCIDSLEINDFMNDETVRQGLHVASNAPQFQECNSDIKYDQGYGSLFAVEKLIKKGQRITVYQGNADAEVPFTGTQKWINEVRDTLELADIVSYTSWFSYPDNTELHLQNNGSYWKMDGMEYVSFKNCGMDVSRCNPEGSLEMFKNYLNKKEMCIIPELCEKK